MAMTKSMGVVGEVPVTIAGEGIPYFVTFYTGLNQECL